jgi:protein-L-isoaspartate(D-aspartate) O-methyltransferase
MTLDLAGFVGRLAASGDLPARWRQAVETVPREAFIPPDIWEHAEGYLRPVRRADDQAAWSGQVYSDEAIIIQADDGATAPGERGDYVSSSASKPSLVLSMLDELDVRPGQKVLEIGTGTGWNAGLLASRLGSDQVVSIEVDAALAERARKSLASVGLHPSVVTGDGADGYSPAAPYDRVISTASVQRVPHAWVEQTARDGLILTPWGTAYHNGALLTLRSTGSGAALGRFTGHLSFMWLRQQRTPFEYLEDQVKESGDAVESVTGLHPYEPANVFDASFAVGVLVPGAQCLVVPDDDGDPHHYVMWLTDVASGSWASLTHWRGANSFPVRQHGPRPLWHEVEGAYQW